MLNLVDLAHIIIFPLKKMDCLQMTSENWLNPPDENIKFHSCGQNITFQPFYDDIYNVSFVDGRRQLFYCRLTAKRNTF